MTPNSKPLCTWHAPDTGLRCYAGAYPGLAHCATHQAEAVRLSDGRVRLVDDVVVVHGARAVPNPLDDVDPFA